MQCGALACAKMPRVSRRANGLLLVELMPGLELLRTNYVTPSRIDLAVEIARDDAPPLATHVGRLARRLPSAAFGGR